MNSAFSRGIIKNTIITSFGQIITILFLFVSSILLARFMPAKELGTFFLIMAVWMFLQMVGNLGLEATLVKYISSKIDGNKNDIFIKLLIIRTISLITIAIIFYLVSLLFVIINETINQYSFLIILIFTLDSLRNFFNAELQGSKKFRDLILVQITQATAKIILYVSAIFFNHLTISYLLYIEILSIIISFIVQQFLTSIKLYPICKISFAEFKEVMRFSFPLYMNNLLGVFSNRINSIIIASFSNVVNVAFYEVGKKIPDGFSRLSSSLTMVFYPYISELFSENNKEKAKQLIEKYINSISLIAAPVILTSFIFRNEIIILLFSSKYSASSLAFSLFTVSFYFGLTSTILGYTLVAANKPTLSFNVNLSKTIIALILTLLFTPSMGFIGAVYSIFISSILGWFFSFYALKTVQISLSPIKFMYPVLLTIPFISLTLYLQYADSKTFFLSSIIILLFISVEYLMFNDFQKLVHYLHVQIKIRINLLLKKGN